MPALAWISTESNSPNTGGKSGWVLRASRGLSPASVRTWRRYRRGPTAVREVLKAEGFAALPRRLDEERPQRPRPTVEAVADVRALSLAPRHILTTCGGLFLFLPHLARLPVETLAQAGRLPGSKMIPPAHALRACLALKLWSLERKSHVMSLVADEGLALFSGLNVTPARTTVWIETAGDVPGGILARTSGA